MGKYMFVYCFFLLLFAQLEVHCILCFTSYILVIIPFLHIMGHIFFLTIPVGKYLDLFLSAYPTPCIVSFYPFSILRQFSLYYEILNAKAMSLIVLFVWISGLKSFTLPRQTTINYWIDIIWICGNLSQKSVLGMEERGLLVK